MSKGFDISKIKEEIDNKKAQKAERAKILGEGDGVTVGSKDQFLAELVHSRNYGVKTNASNNLAVKNKLIEGKRIAKAKGYDTKSVNTNSVGVSPELLEHAAPQVHNSNPQRVAKVPNNMGIGNSKEEEKRRIAQLAEQMEQQEKVRGNQTLGDALSQYTTAPYVGAPMNMNGYLTEAQMRQAMAEKGLQQQPMGGGMIVEQVNNVAQQFLNENFASLFSDALKQTIVEQYKADRVKAAIQENRELIKEIVVETILELQKRNQQTKKA